MTKGMKEARAAMPGELGPAIFLSPHYDDVVLSCGGTVAALVAAGCPPLMVTIFGGETPEELVGDFARWKHRRWGYESADAVLAVRRDEDAVAAAILGCRTRWLGYFDAIYRGERYAADGDLFGRLKGVEAGLIPLIADEILSLPEWAAGTTVYVPLAIGGHVDHQITFAAGRLLAARGITVFAYEDCPYAIHSPGGIALRLASLHGQVGPETLVAIEKTLDRRIAAIAAYTTQVPVIFHFTADMPGAIATHARRIGGALGAAERYWPVLETRSTGA
ncbi:MAG TPA: PIG-L family deacetylase [Thermomicrobiales bacterium]